jgi:Calcineurin-like phosphoesterase
VIAQILNREYTLASTDAVREGLERELALGNRRGAGPLAEFDEADLQSVLDALSRIKDKPEGLEEAERPPEEPGGEAPPPRDDYAYVPRDPLVSIVQSAIEEQVALRAGDEITETRYAEDRRGPGPSPVTALQFADVPLTRTPEGRRLWKRFEVARPLILSDPRWVLSEVVILWNKLRKPAPFNPAPAGPIPMADKARILLVGDWGSGLDRAKDVAARMRESLRDGAAEGRQQAVIHVGDVYYTGGENEYKERFLADWPVDPGQDVMSFTLNGNHDMYQGAHHYFDTALADERFSKQENSSVFSLRNDHWQFLGLDTAYEDAGLYGDQSRWAQQLIASADGRQTVLLSHHQLFSAFEARPPKLPEKIAPVLATGGVQAWFWGHEHRCLVYRGAANLPFASCVGHGGLPEYTSTGLPIRFKDMARLTYDYVEPYGDGWQPWIRFGFAVLDLDGGRMHITYVDEFGNRHHCEDLP